MKPHAIPPGNRGHHALQVYGCEETLCESIADFLADGFAAAQPTVIIATPARCDLILRELRARRFDVATLLESGTLLVLDAEEMLRQVIVRGRPDTTRFREAVSLIFGRVAPTGGERIARVYAELVDILWRRHDPEGAVMLEALWNQLMTMYAFSLLCGFAVSGFYRYPAHEEVCAQHTHVHIPATV